ncbi:MAG: hypothetical protein KAW12_20445 [Candidatus Aminicenantes bacterium]|nr:hypothetical protein [Candidatus Aminicenantes bacterium]
MDIDMHLYGVYALARAAGIKDNTAWDIAYCSQFVDDSVEDEDVVIEDDFALLPAMTSHAALDLKNAERGDQWKVWLPFHFLPGNEPENGTFLQRLTCRKNSKVAQKMVADALDEKNRRLWPHLIGVTAHVYADTFAHYGFVGIGSSANKVKTASVKSTNIEHRKVAAAVGEMFENIAGKLAEIVPVGHGSVATHPDIPFLSWEYKYETDLITSETIKRENAKDFLEGAEALHSFFGKFIEKSPDDADPGSKRKWADIAPKVKEIIALQSHGDKDRVERWKKAIRDGEFFSPTKVDRSMEYDEYLMTLKRLKEIKVSKEEARDSDALKFHRAARYHRVHVMHNLLPEFDILVE